MKNNKKASGTIYLAPWLFLIWIIVTVAVIIMTTIFFGFVVDVRLNEADIFSNRIANCLANNFTYSEVTNPNFNLMIKCGFNEKFFNYSDKHSYTIIISKDYFEPKKSSITFSKGRDFSQECSYRDPRGNIENSFAQCTNKTIIVLDKTDNKSYKINILTASKQK